MESRNRNRVRSKLPNRFVSMGKGVSFGLVNSTRDPRILQVAGKFYW